MKRILVYLALTLIYMGQILGARAYPHPKIVMQPDGTQLTLIGHGDEFSHCVTTSDGYTVIKGDDGWYRYATIENNHVCASPIIANEKQTRTDFENSFLKSIPPFLSNPITSTGERLRNLATRSKGINCVSHSLCSSQKFPTTRAMDNKTYKGLVILVEFSDKSFSRGNDAMRMVDNMMNEENYTGYYDPVLKANIPCTGSVRDYFRDNSHGMFVPEFDVVGPIKIDESQYYINGIERTYELCRMIMAAVDDQVDFSKYDWDDDGEIDMVYLLYAGYSSSYQGNDERLVWAHAGHMADSDFTVTLDGKKLGRFACSSEIFGWHEDGDLYLDGIGVIVHEFSHILGFKDHYDVSGFLNEDPGTWDVMASGNYNGMLNDTPCGYNSYERYAAGFIKPTTLTEQHRDKVLSLSDLSTSGEAYRIVSMQDSTTFMLENRQLTKWDSELPGHGMLVWRVDSCDTQMWTHNALNVNNRLHFKLVRANGASFNIFHEMEDNDGDPFPGSRNITTISNFSLESNLLTDFLYPSPIILNEIQETDGIISFTAGVDEYAKPAPYTFKLKELYDASGLLVDDDGEKPIKWEITTGTIPLGTVEKKVFYNFIPDIEGIGAASSDASGLAAGYSIGSDKLSVTIEPARVAFDDQTGIWLVDFTDLDNGGSGAITLDLDPYGNISLSNPESVIGYCTMPKKCVVVDPIKIIRRFSLVKELTFSAMSSVNDIMNSSFIQEGSNMLYNLQGIPVDSPQKGGVYILKGKKIKW